MTPTRIRILLVDDNPLDRKAALRSVQEQGLPWGMMPAGSIAEARELLRERSFDVAVVDYRLPDGVGTGLLADLGDTPMVIVTGSGSEEIAAEAMRQGAYDYLVKDPDRRYLALLPATISAVLARRKAEIIAAERAMELARSNAELDRFAAAIAHDLKNPVGTILGYTELVLAENPGLDRAATENLQAVQRTAIRMASMINELLDYARITGSAKSHSEVDLRAVVGEVTEDLARVVRETGGTIDAGDLPVVRGDAARLRQLLQNLISNAMKYRRDDLAPVVRIAARQVKGGWQISVLDNGIGIDPADHQRIFGLFERVQRSGAPEGDGIGLATCRRIVEQHHGHIWVESKRSQGTTVHFTLAGGDTESPSPEADETEEPPPSEQLAPRLHS